VGQSNYAEDDIETHGSNWRLDIYIGSARKRKRNALSTTFCDNKYNPARVDEEIK